MVRLILLNFFSSGLDHGFMGKVIHVMHKSCSQTCQCDFRSAVQHLQELYKQLGPTILMSYSPFTKCRPLVLPLLTAPLIVLAPGPNHACTHICDQFGYNVGVNRSRQ